MRKIITISIMSILVLGFSVTWNFFDNNSSKAEAYESNRWKIFDRGEFIEFINDAGIKADTYYSLKKGEIICFTLKEKDKYSAMVFYMTHGINIRIDGIKQQQGKELYKELYNILMPE